MGHCDSYLILIPKPLSKVLDLGPCPHVCKQRLQKPQVLGTCTFLTRLREHIWPHCWPGIRAGHRVEEALWSFGSLLMAGVVGVHSLPQPCEGMLFSLAHRVGAQ